MRVMVIGSGGREHAIAERLGREKSVSKVYVAPGNAGTDTGKLESVDAHDIEGWVNAAMQLGVDLTVIGPERPLADGVVDVFKKKGLPVLGPTKAAARIETSKSFAKKIMAKRGVPTAAHAIATKPAEVERFCDGCQPPYVIKADGLAGGKSATFSHGKKEALDTAIAFFAGRHGKASKTIVIEKMLGGEELSLTALCSGRHYVLLPSCKDHKGLLDGNKGPMTGGMGAISPAPAATMGLIDMQEAGKTAIAPVLEELADRGCPFVGFLYAGLMVTGKGEYFVLEYNCRLGDPEAQVIQRRVSMEIMPSLLAAAQGQKPAELVFSKEHAVGLVLASEGYPGNPCLGQKIELPHTTNRWEALYHAGTKLDEKGLPVVSSGRVICATCTAKTRKKARDLAYELAAKVRFPQCKMRSDIG